MTFRSVVRNKVFYYGDPCSKQGNGAERVSADSVLIF